MMKSFLILIFIIFINMSAQSQIREEVVEYDHKGTILEGHFFYDQSTRALKPAVLIVHQWKGPGDHEFRIARKLAAEGYFAFVVDIYGKGVRPRTSEEAGQTAGKLRNDIDLMRGRINSALQYVRTNSLIDPGKIAAIGYCFGGGVVLELARSGADIDGVVSFHGSLLTPRPEDAGNIKGKVLVLHGAADRGQSANLDAVKKLSEEMESAGVDYEIVLYGGAVHSFTDISAGGDPSTNSAYDEEADRRSWNEMLTFFNEIFE
jgi:dienelactone hydrolase